MAFKHMSLLWSAKGVIMGHVGDMPFMPGQKTHITRSRGWYGFFARAKTSQSEHSAVLHLISNRQICQKEKCMINRLWNCNFHIIPPITPRPISARVPKARGLISQCWVDMGYDMKIHIIISIYCVRPAKPWSTWASSLSAWRRCLHSALRILSSNCKDWLGDLSLRWVNIQFCRNAVSWLIYSKYVFLGRLLQSSLSIPNFP